MVFAIFCSKEIFNPLTTEELPDNCLCGLEVFAHRVKKDNKPPR